jgi:hypothetical protein
MYGDEALLCFNFDVLVSGKREGETNMTVDIRVILMVEKICQPNKDVRNDSEISNLQ